MADTIFYQTDFSSDDGMWLINRGNFVIANGKASMTVNECNVYRKIPVTDAMRGKSIVARAIGSGFKFYFDAYNSGTWLAGAGSTAGTDINLQIPPEATWLALGFRNEWDPSAYVDSASVLIPDTTPTDPVDPDPEEPTDAKHVQVRWARVGKNGALTEVTWGRAKAGKVEKVTWAKPVNAT